MCGTVRHAGLHALRRHMTPWLLALMSLGALAPVQAADLAQPVITPIEPLPAPRPFFLHVGVVGSFFDTGLATNIAGAHVAGSGGTIGSAVSGAIETGVYLPFVLPHFAIAFSAGYPPVLALTGTGVFAPQSVLVKAQSGIATLTGQYHLDNFGPVKPYAGLGIGYALVFRDIATLAVVNPELDNNVGFVLQGGVDYALTDRFGVFVDLKKVWLHQTLTGMVAVPGTPGLLPVSARVRSDPLILTSGLSINF